MRGSIFQDKSSMNVINQNDMYIKHRERIDVIAGKSPTVKDNKKLLQKTRGLHTQTFNQKHELQNIQQENLRILRNILSIRSRCMDQFPALQSPTVSTQTIQQTPASQMHSPRSPQNEQSDSKLMLPEIGSQNSHQPKRRLHSSRLNGHKQEQLRNIDEANLRLYQRLLKIDGSEEVKSQHCKDFFRQQSEIKNMRERSRVANAQVGQKWSERKFEKAIGGFDFVPTTGRNSNSQLRSVMSKGILGSQQETRNRRRAGSIQQSARLPFEELQLESNQNDVDHQQFFADTNSLTGKRIIQDEQVIQEAAEDDPAYKTVNEDAKNKTQNEEAGQTTGMNKSRVEENNKEGQDEVDQVLDQPAYKTGEEEKPQEQEDQQKHEENGEQEQKEDEKIEDQQKEQTDIVKDQEKPVEENQEQSAEENKEEKPEGEAEAEVDQKDLNLDATFEANDVRSEVAAEQKDEEHQERLDELDKTDLNERASKVSESPKSIKKQSEASPESVKRLSVKSTSPKSVTKNQKLSRNSSLEKRKWENPSLGKVEYDHQAQDNIHLIKHEQKVFNKVYKESQLQEKKISMIVAKTPQKIQDQSSQFELARPPLNESQLKEQQLADSKSQAYFQSVFDDKKVASNRKKQQVRQIKDQIAIFEEEQSLKMKKASKDLRRKRLSVDIVGQNSQAYLNNGMDSQRGSNLQSEMQLPSTVSDAQNKIKSPLKILAAVDQRHFALKSKRGSNHMGKFTQLIKTSDPQKVAEDREKRSSTILLANNAGNNEVPVSQFGKQKSKHNAELIDGRGVSRFKTPMSQLGREACGSDLSGVLANDEAVQQRLQDTKNQNTDSKRNTHKSLIKTPDAIQEDSDHANQNQETVEEVVE